MVEGSDDPIADLRAGAGYACRIRPGQPRDLQPAHRSEQRARSEAAGGRDEGVAGSGASGGNNRTAASVGSTRGRTDSRGRDRGRPHPCLPNPRNGKGSKREGVRMPRRMGAPPTSGLPAQGHVVVEQFDKIATGKCPARGPQLVQRIVSLKPFEDRSRFVTLREPIAVVQLDAQQVRKVPPVRTQPSDE